jgi:hypothetical protein
VTIALLFWGLVLLCGGFAATYGGRAGRHIALIYFAACLATSWVTRDDLAWLHPHLPAFGVDLALLGALGWVAFRSDRWFPVWFTGLHVVAVTSHLASIVVPDFSPRVYFLVQALWSVPMLLTLAIGVALDRRAGVADAPGTRY